MRSKTYINDDGFMGEEITLILICHFLKTYKSVYLISLNYAAKPLYHLPLNDFRSASTSFLTSILIEFCVVFLLFF